MTRVKICGITRLEDAQSAIDAGADALGFIFYEKSKRFITFEKAREIIDSVPPFISCVGVFVNPSEEFVARAIHETRIDTLQFHGDESNTFCLSFGLKTIKAFRVKDRESLKGLPDYKTSAWLLDSYVPGELGGTGESFNWDLAVEAKKLDTPIVLAGGLTPENVRSAVETVRPFGVDVSSGVENAPGIKDTGKIQAFISAAKSMD